MTVLYTAWAKNQLREIYNYYKEIGSPKKGRKIRISIHKIALLLKTFPLLGREEDLLSMLSQGHRYIVEGQYKIIYRIIDDKVYITDIFDTRRNPDTITP